MLSAATKAKFARTQTEGYAVCVRLQSKRKNLQFPSNKYRCEHPFSLQICLRTTGKPRSGG